jgi:ATP-dependent RNA helicase DeaD
MDNFESFGLSPALLKGVTELGFATPTPVQAKVIPLAPQGQARRGRAGPDRHRQDRRLRPAYAPADRRGHAVVQALILCPTRELCLQITATWPTSAGSPPSCVCWRSTAAPPSSVQMRTLHRGVHILVATPGRLNDLLRRGGVKLDTVQRVVLDEADEMLNMGFQEELETILQQVPDAARTLLFSATMPKAGGRDRRPST